MALTETQAFKVEVLEDLSINVRRADIVLRDGTEIARSYNRVSFTPNANVKNQPAVVQAIAASVWTSEFLANDAS